MSNVNIQICVAGYDMQFDIKYAYFNFLQSIHHGSTLMNYDATKFTLSDELCIDANELEAEEANQEDTKDERALIF